jgi:hypothetical protein
MIAMKADIGPLIGVFFKYKKNNFSCFVWLQNLRSFSGERTEFDDVWKQNTAKIIWLGQEVQWEWGNCMLLRRLNREYFRQVK